MYNYCGVINDLADELRVETKDKGEWIDFFECPQCGVKNFQCGFNRTTGTFNCFHCGAGHIKDFKELPKESMDSTSSPTTVFVNYEYKLNGQLIAVKHRYYKPDGSKGQFMDTEYETSPKIFYNHDILKDIKEVYLVEGEKDVDTLTKYNFPAITKPFGAKQKWANWMTESLKYIEKIIGCYDNDEAGEEGTLIAARELKNKFVSIHWKDGTPNKYDVTDLINEKGIEAFKELVKKAVPVKLPGVMEVIEDVFYWQPDQDVKYVISNLQEKSDGITAQVSILRNKLDNWRLVIRDKIKFWSLQSIQRLSKIVEISEQVINNHLIEFEKEYAKYKKNILAEIENKERQKVYEMTPEEEEQATEFLKNPRLFYRIIEDINSIGYVGEVTNKILLYLIAISRKMETPLGTVVKSPSAGGKSEGVNAVKTLCPRKM